MAVSLFTAIETTYNVGGYIRLDIHGQLLHFEQWQWISAQAPRFPPEHIDLQEIHGIDE